MRTCSLLVLVLLSFGRLYAQQARIAGDWTEATGSIIRIAPCGNEFCARLISVSSQAPTRFDIHNPDEALRRRPLCGLEIGRGFHVLDPDHAEGGFLYDPKSGKTYHGSIARDGDRLQLRGYVGIKLFGRTETWRRPTSPVRPCTP